MTRLFEAAYPFADDVLALPVIDLEPSVNRLNQWSLCSKLGKESRARAAEGGSRWPERILKICGSA